MALGLWASFARQSFGKALATSTAGRPTLLAPRLQTALFVRGFATEKGTMEDRVIKAVKTYAAMRADEVKRDDGTTAGDKDKLIEALGGDVTTGTKWDDLGFDDLDRVEVLLEVEEEFNHTIPDNEADAISSVEETLAYLRKHAAAE
eukprot:TRINITY_DN5138_c0_g1_i2.p1 TRINITY_DN5138_c0_g1~~TRINITY_DN5138_c0_g1_i2.p1  ORF type:complete len:147 (+),score=50.12 TRINITY_DN5138_c0_g1_i2:110-550(+)